jgi:hypothetical protein
MEGFSYFPATVYRDERFDLVDSSLRVLAKYLNKLPGEQLELPIVQTEHLGNDPEIQDLINYLLVSSVDILRGQGYAVDKYDFYFSGMWGQEVKKGNATNVHVHKNSQICGWFFLDVPENGAYPIYYDTRANKGMIELDFVQGDEITNATSSINFNNVKAGTVMFGNSWMQHQLLSGTSELPTRCIHFIVSHKDRQCNIC